jgi:hypothetical protein
VYPFASFDLAKGDADGGFLLWGRSAFRFVFSFGWRSIPLIHRIGDAPFNDSIISNRCGRN